MDPENLPTNTTALRVKAWLQNKITPDFFVRVALTLTICLVIYLGYLLINGGQVSIGVLFIFVLTSLASQVFFFPGKENYK